MKAIVLQQPWATLVALHLKWIETRGMPPSGEMRPEGVRGLPGFGINRGERIAILAAASKPSKGWSGGGHFLVDGGRKGHRHLWVADGCERGVKCGRSPSSHIVPLPLGAIVATAVVTDAVMVTAGSGAPHWARSSLKHLPHEGDLPHQQGGLWLVGQHPKAPLRVEDQAPYGDFTNGRWGWLLDDVIALDEPVPAQGQRGVFKIPNECIPAEAA